MRQSIELPTSEILRPTVRSVWSKPELYRLEAGAAESAGHAGNDGTTNLS